MPNQAILRAVSEAWAVEQVKFLSRLLFWLCWPWMWLFSLLAIIHAEKDPAQRRYNWQILSYLFSPALLLSDNIVVKAKKTITGESGSRS